MFCLATYAKETHLCHFHFNFGVYWCLGPVRLTRAVSIFRHGRANRVLLVCAAAVLLRKVHLHFFVVAFFLLPWVDRHGSYQNSRGWRRGKGFTLSPPPGKRGNAAQTASRLASLALLHSPSWTRNHGRPQPITADSTHDSQSAAGIRSRLRQRSGGEL